MISGTTVNTDVTIRAATAKDLPRVERLLRESELPLDGVSDCIDDFLLAEADGEIVGVAGLECCSRDAILRSVAVKPAWRSRGLGRALVMRAIARAEARGIRALYLLTTTAEHYFPSFGFRTVQREQVPDDVRATAEFTTACPSTATVMSRELAAVPG